MNVAFIPVRGGSKSIPLKNIKLMNGKPLVFWTVNAAVSSNFVDKVYIATDSAEIKKTVEAFNYNKVEVIGRSPESASDYASTECVMLEFAKEYDFNNIILIQATSPLLQSEDIDGGFSLFFTKDTDSVLSVVRQKRFQWEYSENAFVNPVNYDIFARPRRQDYQGFLVENGAFYITNREKLLQSKNRISGRIKAYEMSEETYYEIDEISDWLIVEQIMKAKNGNSSINIPNIKMFLTDCDGCLTDAGMYYFETGIEGKKFNTRDGMGITKLREMGIITGIITGEDNEIVKSRAKKLKIDELHMGINDKLSVVKSLSDKYKIQMEEIAYVGDDMNDLEVIKSVGLGCSVNDAMPIVKQVAQYVSVYNGGEGAIRDIVDFIISGKSKGEYNG